MRSDPATTMPSRRHAYLGDARPWARRRQYADGGEGKGGEETGVGRGGEGTTPGCELVPGEEGCPEGPHGREGSRPSQARRSGGAARRPSTRQLAVANVATTSLTTVASSAVERWVPGCDAIQMAKAQRRTAARAEVAAKRRDDPQAAWPGGLDPGPPLPNASGPGASARTAAPSVTVSAVSTAMILIAPALSVGPSVFDVLRTVASATRRRPSDAPRSHSRLSALAGRS